MKKLSLCFALLMLFVSLLSGCNIASKTNNAQMGAAGGAAGGAVIGQAIGSSTEATLIGAAIGLGLGYLVGNEMDKADQQKMAYALETTPTGQTTAWDNPDKKAQYSVTPTETYTANNQQCKRAEILTTINGRAEKTYTTACKNTAGAWVIKG